MDLHSEEEVLLDCTELRSVNCLVNSKTAKPRPKADRGAACKRQVFKFHITSPRQPVEGSARRLWVICLSSMNFERLKRRESADGR